MKKLFLLVLFSTFLVASMTFLMPNEAFKPSVKLDNKQNVVATIDLGDKIYVYKEKLKLQLVDNKYLALDRVEMPKGKEHNGDIVYFGSPHITLILKKKKEFNDVKNIDIKLSFQGCSEAGLCYEPEIKKYKLSINGSKFSTTLPQTQQIAQQEFSQSDMIANTLKDGNIFLVLVTFFGFGLLLALTPCVFPMIPIISGVIISQGKGITTKKALLLSLVYVLAMSVAYTIAGVLAGLFGSNLQAALQAPWVIYSFSAIFVALAMSMFGYYELKLPDALVSKVSQNSSKTGYVGVAIMGFLSALIVGPCVAAPLAGALVYIGQTGDALLGGLALFVMSLGMGMPLIAVGVSAGKFMPKPGAWMNMVSAIFGVMMLGVAIWMLERIVDSYVTMILYAVLGIGFSLYLGLFETGGHLFKKSVRVILFIYSVALFIGALGGSTSMLKPLSFLTTTHSSQVIKSSQLDFQVVDNEKELNEILSKSIGKKVMLDFSAEWCALCKELEENTFSNKEVQSALKDFVLIQVDLTDNTKETKALSKKYRVFGPPVVLFFNKDGKLLPSKTLNGYVAPSKFLTHLSSF
jgi:thiol:disulfide interchange protein DsbD